MLHFWVYDWEVYYNFACVTFIHTNTPSYLIEAYIEIDIKYLECKKEIHLIEEDNDFIEDSHYISLKETFNKLKLAKQQVLDKMISKAFIIYKDRYDSSKNICQLAELLMFFNNHKTVIGYNSYNYDSIITDFILISGRNFDINTGNNLNGIHITQILKEVSDEIISVSKAKLFNYKYSWIPYKYKRTYNDYDIQKILYLDKSFVGLKSVAINLRWHRIEELPLPPDSFIEFNQIYDIYDYNINDVLITLRLIENQSEELNLRKEISDHYNIDVLNESRSSIGKRLMSKYYSETSGIPYKDFKDLRTTRSYMKLSSIISDRIRFITPELQEFLKKLKSKVISPDTDFTESLFFRNTLYTLGKGGIHSVDDSRIYSEESDDYEYEDADVTSYYPSIILIFKISPKHIIKDIFLYLVNMFTQDRVEAKREGNKIKAEALKIVINRIYGALKDIMDYLFDPKATYEVTFNGQLSLLMLIERLESMSGGAIHCISANTDGIVCKFRKRFRPLYEAICKEWEIDTGFNLEFTSYEKYVRNNVNEYIAIKKGFRKEVEKLLKSNSEDIQSELKVLENKYVKGKGSYISDTPFNKGFSHPIVSIALRNYVLYNDDYKEIIKNHYKKHRFNIYDYCISQKVDRKFDVMYTRVVKGEIVKTPLQQYNRFYVSKTGGTITKEDIYEEKQRSQSLVAKKSLTLFNDYTYKEDYNIDFNFYIKKVEEFLYYKKIKSKGNHKYEGINVRSNTLFNDEND